MRRVSKATQKRGKVYRFYAERVRSRVNRGAVESFESAKELRRRRGDHVRFESGTVEKLREHVQPREAVTRARRRRTEVSPRIHKRGEDVFEAHIERFADSRDGKAFVFTRNETRVRENRFTPFRWRKFRNVSHRRVPSAQQEKFVAASVSWVFRWKHHSRGGVHANERGVARFL